MGIRPSSEFPPSESTVIRKAAFDSVYLNHLRDACGFSAVTKVARTPARGLKERRMLTVSYICKA